MNIKHFTLTTLLTTLALTGSASAIEKKPAFQVAIIKDFPGSHEISSGEFAKSIKYLTKTNVRHSSFEINMGLCVAYIKMNNTDKSEAACTKAINDAKLSKVTSQQSTYLKAVSYSNRGISRYLENDISGAIEDLTFAATIDANAITKNNLQVVKSKLMSEEPNNLIALSD
jgi:hypothetical protein